MRETFITAVIKEHCHQRPDKPRHASADDGVPDTAANLLWSMTPVYSPDARKASALLFSANAVFVNDALEKTSRLLIRF